VLNAKSRLGGDSPAKLGLSDQKMREKSSFVSSVNLRGDGAKGAAMGAGIKFL